MKKNGRNLVIINLPEEYNGAQVFRNGFAEALLLQHMDTAGIKVINYLVSEDAELINNVISPLYTGNRVTIAPHVFISGDTITARIRANANDTIRFHLATEDMIYYWNKEAFIPLNNPLKHAN